MSDNPRFENTLFMVGAAAAMAVILGWFFFWHWLLDGSFWAIPLSLSPLPLAVIVSDIRAWLAARKDAPHA